MTFLAPLTGAPEVANLYKCYLFAMYCQTLLMVDRQPKSDFSWMLRATITLPWVMYECQAN